MWLVLVKTFGAFFKGISWHGSPWRESPPLRSYRFYLVSKAHFGLKELLTCGYVLGACIVRPSSKELLFRHNCYGCLLSTLEIGRKSKPQTVKADALAIA